MGKYLVACMAVIVTVLCGCSESRVTADDLATAMGIKCFYLKIPEASSAHSIGFTYKDKDGVKPPRTITPGFKSGIVKVLYWKADGVVKYVFIEKNHSSPGTLQIDDIEKYKGMEAHSGGKIFKLGEIVGKWSSGNSITSDDTINKDEIGFLVVEVI